MKMEIPIQAEVSGREKAVKVSDGAFVDEETILLELE